MEKLTKSEWTTIRVDKDMADELTRKLNAHFNIAHGPVSRNRAVNIAITHALKTMFNSGKKDWIA